MKQLKSILIKLWRSFKKLARCTFYFIVESIDWVFRDVLSENPAIFFLMLFILSLYGYMVGKDLTQELKDKKRDKKPPQN